VAQVRKLSGPMRFKKEFMERILRVFDLVFGCHHRNLSMVFTINRRTYRVCCDCGATFRYSLVSMSMDHHRAYRTTPALSDATGKAV
jgi:hypothetical protein